jgi:IS30 family transposase
MPYSHFAIDDRDALQVLLAIGGLAIWEIARIIGKHQSCVYRELSRNANNDFYHAYLS